MKTTLYTTPLKDSFIVIIDYFEDERGFFIENWSKRDFLKAGLQVEFLQEGHSRSKKNVLRGLHFQDMRAPMAKLVRCTVGEIFDVLVDLRLSSPTFGKWFGITLSAENKKQLFVPAGFAHGFLTKSDVAEVQYKQSAYYTPESEGSLIWNDQDVGIQWGTKTTPLLSQKDAHAHTLAQYLRNPAFK